MLKLQWADTLPEDKTPVGVKLMTVKFATRSQ